MITIKITKESLAALQELFKYEYANFELQDVQLGCNDGEQFYISSKDFCINIEAE